MVTQLDGFMPGLAAKLLKQYGKRVTITTKGNSAYDPTQSAPASSTPVTQTVYCTINEYPDALRTLGDGIAKSGNSIIDGDKKVIVAAQNLTFIPQSGDKMIIDNVGYYIVGSGAQYSGELVAYYDYHVRKA